MTMWYEETLLYHSRAHQILIPIAGRNVLVACVCLLAGAEKKISFDRLGRYYCNGGLRNLDEESNDLSLSLSLRFCIVACYVQPVPANPVGRAYPTGNKSSNHRLYIYRMTLGYICI